MVASHKEHPLGIAEVNMKLKASGRQLDGAMGRAYEREKQTRYSDGYQ
ncbi:hypothetical protein PI125_g6993 [Phytophthora idaei]|nr:hypothetical protein PI125_g6993 [Phytophthora idaei]